MARTAQRPGLSLGNHIYLYRLLSQELGCGKQTFLPRVEEALASDRMTADDLGFATTRELLEALDDFIALTVFKGGRIYATVKAQEAWDAALAIEADGKGAGGTKNGKPWKRKKGDRALKPVKPKRVKREVETEGETEGETAKTPAETTAGIDATAQATSADDDMPSASAEHENADASPAIETMETSSAAAPDDTASPAEPEPQPASSDAAAAQNAPEASTDPQPAADAALAAEAPEPKPTISLTVTYDPYSGTDEETKLELDADALAALTASAASSDEDAQRAEEPALPPAAATRNAARPAATEPTVPQPAAVELQASAGAPATSDAGNAHADSPAALPGDTASAAPAPAAPASPAAPLSLGPVPSDQALASYPEDFANEVYCPAAIVAELTRALPFGTDALRLLAEDYARARSLGLVAGTRARLAFPLRVEHADSTRPVVVRVRKQGGPGLAWALADIE